MNIENENDYVLYSASPRIIWNNLFFGFIFGKNGCLDNSPIALWGQIAQKEITKFKNSSSGEEDFK